MPRAATWRSSSEDEVEDPQLAGEESGLFRSERLSTLNFWDSCWRASISSRSCARASRRPTWIGRWDA